MSRILTLASGSSGNCTYIGHKKSGIIIDTGISAKAITDGLELVGTDPKCVSAIFITHEHIDHVSGLRVFANKYNIPVFASDKTAQALITHNLVDSKTNLNVFDDTIAVGDILVKRFGTSHDCEGSSGYSATFDDGRKCSVCTDLGIMTDTVRNEILGSTAILLESNHDVTLLQKGSYPEYLKRRILSDKGHLSNVACATELSKFVDSGTTRIILGHLSRENNRPEIAKSTAVSALMDYKMVENEDYILTIAPPKLNKAIMF